MREQRVLAFYAELRGGKATFMGLFTERKCHCVRAMFATTGKFAQTNAEANLFALC